jgi:hypothetical protein
MKPYIVEGPKNLFVNEGIDLAAYYSDYAIAVCRCQVPIGYGIKIPKKEGIISYPFYCKACNTRGTVFSKMKGEKNERHI